MANSKNNNPVLFDLYEQEIHITEPRMVYDGCIDMAGLPDSYIGVTVTDENNNRLVEITDGKAPSEGEFKVDYKHGWLYVDPKAYYKQKLTLDFYSRGIELTPASRIYTIDQNGCVDINKTLQTYIDEVNGHCKFDIADKFENLESGDSFNVMFGKLAKWYEIYNSEIEKIISNTTLIKNEDSGFAAGDMAGTGGGSATGNRASSSDGGAAGSGATTGNGGAVGSEAKSKYGFAGGYGAESTNGSATGEEAKSNDGGAAGYGATTEDGGSVGSHAVSQNGGAVGSEATTMNGGAVGSNAKSGYGFAGGSNAQTGDGGAAGEEAKSSCGFAGGAVAETYDGGAVGSSAKSGNGFSGGAEAQVGKDENDVYIDAIQLGAGTNSNERTLQAYDYQVTAFDGATDTYWLNDVGKLSGLNTTNKDTVVEGINSIVNNTTLIKNSNGGFAAGQDAASEYDGAAIGSEAHTYDGGAVGEHANSGSGGAIGSDSNTNSGGSIGYNTKSTGGGAIGEEAIAGDGFSGGNSAQVGKDTDGVYIDAIQLGTGTNSNDKTLQVYDYQVTAYDSENNTKYLKDVGDLSGLNTVNKSDIVSSINELNSKAVYSFNAVMSSPISITEPFSINSSGDWLVGYTIPSITISNEIFGTFILPTTYLEPAHGYNYGSKYCYAQYTFNVDNPSGTLSETEISVDILYKNVKGNTNSYIEIEDGNIIASINIYLGEVHISRQMNNNNEYDYFGSASVNTESKLSLLCVTQISTLSTRLSSLEKRIALLEQKLATAVSTDALIQGDDTIIFDNGDSVI
ncbi:MAG: hypothetical protein MRZ66_01590 [Clostridiales bacterium]|nr:hypothetical protein [Clostridiales bacterium]